MRATKSHYKTLLCYQVSQTQTKYTNNANEPKRWPMYRIVRSPRRRRRAKLSDHYERHTTYAPNEIA